MVTEAPTVVVTGASSGTGTAVARQLHSRGLDVVVVGRDPTRTLELADELDAPGMTADFANLASVRRLAEELLATLPRIDVLVNNAGAAVTRTQPTADGHESNYQVNALAPFLLLTLLTPALEQAHGRVVSTTSDTHRRARLPVQDLAAELDAVTGRSAMRRYARAKLAALLLHQEHTRRHPALAMAYVHPGVVASGFFRSMGRWGAVATVLARPLLTSPDAAARPLVHLATTDEDIAGRYVHARRPGRPSPLVHDERLARAVWDDAQRRLSAQGEGRQASTEPAAGNGPG